MDRVVKVMLREEDIILLDLRAKDNGVPRMYLLRGVIEKYLHGVPEVPTAAPAGDPGEAKVLLKSLQETQAERDILRSRVNDLETALTERGKDLEFTRGAYQAVTQALNEALAKIPPPVPLIPEKTSWWNRITGKKDIDQGNQ